MPPAARIGDQTTHGGVLAPPPLVTGVWIEGLPAAVVGTQHVCPIPPPHLTATPITKGSTSVFIGGFAAARALVDPTGCLATVVGGAARTEIGG
jgi:uncharacterized Zn-binding protein involved in type VI secretion